MKNMVRVLFLWFYCLDLWAAFLLVLVATVFFALIRDRLKGRRWWPGLLCFALGCWFFLATYSTIAARSGSEIAQHSFVPFHSYWEAWCGGNIEIYRSNFMNVALFYPAGLLAMALLPGRWGWRRRCLLVVLPLAVMSVGIEFLQYRFALGQCEIDDVIHNTLGALLGSLAALLPPILPRKS